MKMAFAIWITGLPGSGKTTIAKALLKKLAENNIEAEFLRLDEIRKKIVPNPEYTAEERDMVYKAYADNGIELVGEGKNVIYEATAHRKGYRNYARNSIKNFIEVYVKCPLNVCIERESKRKEGLVTAEMYKKALERKKTGKKFPELGEVIGVDAPYEENKKAEVVIESEKIGPEKAAEIIFEKIKAIK